MKTGGFGRGALLAAAAMGALCYPQMVSAQEARQQYDVEAPSLADALKELSRQTGIEVIFASDAVAGKTARPLHGSFTSRQAIDRILDGSGLHAEFQDGGYIVRGRPQASAERTSVELPTDIIVTGSRIPGQPSASPLTIASREQIDATGALDLGAFVRTLPQNFNGGQNPNVAGGGAQGGHENTSAASTLNIRGLGANATLTLLNGHRLPYDSLSSGVDISQFPIAAIDRLEIVTDGSSALYGSDAVGGVANVILRNDSTGGEVSARLGGATEGGFFQQQYYALGGQRWSDGGFMIAGQYTKNGAILARERSYTSGLDDSATLYPPIRQVALLLSGHQRISDNIEFAIDGQFNDRTSRRVQPYSTTASAFTSGLIAEPSVQSFSVSPSVKISLPGEWLTTLSGTYGESNDHLVSTAYSGGRESYRNDIHYDNNLGSAEIAAEGPLAKLPGGEVHLALGGGYRQNGLRALLVRTAGSSATTTIDFDKSRNVFFGYGELSAPIFSDLNSVPGIHALNFDAAVRYEDYRGIQGLAIPKFGVVYQPVSTLTLRGSWGRSFKAQTLYQQYQPRQAVLLPSAYYTGAPAGTNILSLAGGNDGLKPEKATTWTASIEYRPPFAKNLKIGASYFNIRYQDRVVSPLGDYVYSAFTIPIYEKYISRTPTTAAVNAAIASAQQGLSNYTGTPFDPASVSAILDLSLQNAARQSVEGVDLTVDYIADFGANQIGFSGSASYSEGTQQLTAGAATTEIIGVVFTPPHWRATGNVSWRRSGFLANVATNYVGPTRDNRSATNYDVSAFFTVDALLSVTSRDESGPLRGVSASINLINIFDKKPSFVRNINPTDPPFDSINTSSIGRAFSFTLTKSFR